MDIAFEISDKYQHKCRVLGPASRAELLRDRYFNRLEIELGSLGQVSEDENIDWLEPSLFPYNPKMLQEDGFDRVYYAIHLLQTDPSVQVQSLVSDSIFIISVYKRKSLYLSLVVISFEYLNLGSTSYWITVVK